MEFHKWYGELVGAAGAIISSRRASGAGELGVGGPGGVAGSPVPAGIGASPARRRTNAFQLMNKCINVSGDRCVEGVG